MVGAWGAALSKESEEIRFTRSICRWPRAQGDGVVTGIAIVIPYVASLPASIKYIAFMKVESASYLRIRFDLLY